MTPNAKYIIFRFFLSGLFFALGLLAFDLAEGKEFNPWEFIIQIFLFGALMTIADEVARPFRKRENDKKLS